MKLIISHQSLGIFMCGILGIPGMWPMKMSMDGGGWKKPCCGMRNCGIYGILGVNWEKSGADGSPHLCLKSATPVSKSIIVPSNSFLISLTYHAISSWISVLTSWIRSKIGLNGHLISFLSGQFSWTFWLVAWIWSLMLSWEISFFESNFISNPSCMDHILAPSSTKRPIC